MISCTTSRCLFVVIIVGVGISALELKSKLRKDDVIHDIIDTSKLL